MGGHQAERQQGQPDKREHRVPHSGGRPGRSHSAQPAAVAGWAFGAGFAGASGLSRRRKRLVCGVPGGRLSSRRPMKATSTISMELNMNSSASNGDPPRVVSCALSRVRCSGRKAGKESKQAALSCPRQSKNHRRAIAAPSTRYDSGRSRRFWFFQKRTACLPVPIRSAPRPPTPHARRRRMSASPSRRPPVGTRWQGRTGRGWPGCPGRTSW